MSCQKSPNYNAVQSVGVNKKNPTAVHTIIHFVPRNPL